MTKTHLSVNPVTPPLPDQNLTVANSYKTQVFARSIITSLENSLQYVSADNKTLLLMVQNDYPLREVREKLQPYITSSKSSINLVAPDATQITHTVRARYALDILKLQRKRHDREIRIQNHIQDLMANEYKDLSPPEKYDMELRLQSLFETDSEI